jgi:hypothetical protein
VDKRLISASLMRLLLVFSATALALGTAAPARGTDSDWTERDFRLRAVTAHLGDPAQSFIELNGTMTRQAREAGFYPHVRFIMQVRITCVSTAEPAQTVTRTTTLDSRHSDPMVVSSGLTFTHLDAGTIKWTARFTFAVETGTEYANYVWCQAAPDFVVRDIVLTGATGITWLSVTNFSPTPGTSLYEYEIPSGQTTLRFRPRDGIGY